LDTGDRAGDVSLICPAHMDHARQRGRRARRSGGNECRSRQIGTAAMHTLSLSSEGSDVGEWMGSSRCDCDGRPRHQTV